jgi:molybdate transport repressor ModE-like protein
MHGDGWIKGLLAFLQIAEEGSINQAARALNVSQPSLTRTLQQFEAMIGAPVFERSKKGVTLNPLGRQLVRHAQAIRAETNNVARTVETFRKEERRQLHVGVMTAHPQDAFAEAILAFTRESPDVFLRISHGTQKELLALMGDGAIEMIFGPLIPPPAGSALVQDPIYSEVIDLYCGAASPLARAPRVTIADLAAAAWILPPPGAPARDEVAGLFARAGQAAPRLFMEVENDALRRVFVRQSHCLSAFYAHHVHKEVEAGLIKRVMFDWSCGVGPVGALRLMPHTPLSRRLLSVVERHYAAIGLSDGSMPACAELRLRLNAKY